LSYTVSGDPRRPAILLLHGFMGSGADWAVAISALDERFYCVAPDLPGHGASLGMPHQGAYTIEGAAQALLALLDELEIERPLVVGYSMGGRLALYLALRHPEGCSALFLESASPGIEDAATPIRSWPSVWSREPLEAFSRTGTGSRSLRRSPGGRGS
jgi:pimeloyl-ACP methyl ester carboxylesterase